MATRCSRAILTVALLLAAPALPAAEGPQSRGERPLDRKVEQFLHAHRDQWRDMNVPAGDGKRLHDLIVEHGFTRALEIGTSTGHSAIWMAWALSKTGGRLTTIEIDADRREEALRNFEEAGLSAYIDARLGDAHELVGRLTGPFDFVFVDADKAWSKQYFRALSPKLARGGCYTMHNVRNSHGDIGEFLEYVRSLPDYETTIDESSASGISISCKKSAAPPKTSR